MLVDATVVLVGFGTQTDLQLGCGKQNFLISDIQRLICCKVDDMLA